MEAISVWWLAYPALGTSITSIVFSALASAAIGVPLSLGYVNLPALIGVVSCTMLLAPLGVRVASRMNMGKLKRVYGVYLLIIAAKMLHTALI